MNKEFTRMQKLAGILTEGFQGQFYAPEYLEEKYGKEMASKIHHEIDEMDENSWDRFTDMYSAEEVEDYIADIKDMLGLTESTDKGPKRAAMMEPGKGKMKKSEFKKKLKEAILAEKALKEDADLDTGNLGGDNTATDQAYADMDLTEYFDSYSIIHQEMRKRLPAGVLESLADIVVEIVTILQQHKFPKDEILHFIRDNIQAKDSDKSLEEAKEKKKEDEEEVDIDLGTDGENIDLNLDGTEGTNDEMDMGDTRIDMNMDTANDIDSGSSESKKAFSELTDAYRAAKVLGDEKLIRQIANTITYFNKNIILSQG